MVVDFVLSFTVRLQLYGLILDFIGALALGRSVVKGRRGLRESASVKKHVIPGDLRGSKLASSDLIYDSHASVDGLWGAFLLPLGFLIQILAVIGPLRLPIPTWL